MKAGKLKGVLKFLSVMLIAAGGVESEMRGDCCGANQFE
jgi:hypothetical protein